METKHTPAGQKEGKQMKRWVGATPENLVTAPYKRLLPHLQPYQTTERIEFNFCCCWVVRDISGGGLLQRDGTLLDVAEVMPVEGDAQKLIGRNDAYQLGSGARLDIFRSALIEREQRK